MEKNILSKTINSTCCCGLHMTNKKDAYIVLLPCEHIFHQSCIKEKIKCPLCNEHIKYQFHEKHIKLLSNKHYKFKQESIDILSLKPFNYYASINYGIFLSRSLVLANYARKILISNNEKEIKNNLLQIFYNAGIKIVQKGIINSNQIVYIANHTSSLDPVIIYFLTSSGFVGSEKFIKKSSFGKKALQLLPIIPITRGKKANVVNKMKNYMNINKGRSICVFPEGTITHPNTIAKFRSGAFNINKPVQPIIIKYDLPISSSNINDFILKTISQKQLKIEVTFLKTQYPPFDNYKIEKIRMNMAKEGKMYLSRISNRDINDSN